MHWGVWDTAEQTHGDRPVKGGENTFPSHTLEPSGVPNLNSMTQNSQTLSFINCQRERHQGFQVNLKLPQNVFLPPGPLTEPPSQDINLPSWKVLLSSLPSPWLLSTKLKKIPTRSHFKWACWRISTRAYAAHESQETILMILKSRELSITFFCKGPSNKYFGLWGSEGLCCNYSIVLAPKATKGRHTNKWVCRVSIKLYL